MNITTKDLTKSPIFNLSLCSLENFHTAFCTWVGNEYPKEFIKIFSNKDYSNSDSIQFMTQVNCGHDIKLDLEIVVNDGQLTEYIIVENKLKSFPTDEQLNKYTDHFKNKKASFILLSFAPTFDLPNNWSYISYSVLADKMNAIFNDKFNYKEQYHKYIIEDYINVVSNIADKFPVTNTKTYDFYNKTALNEIGLEDIYVKFRTAELTNYIKANLKDNSWKTSHSFHHKKGTIDIWKDIDELNCTIGIQIEEKQYRYFLLTNKQDSTEKREEIATELLKEQYWFNNTKQPTRQSIYKQFCGYAPNRIYRYYEINEISYEELVTKINDDIKQVNDNFESIKNIVKN